VKEIGIFNQSMFRRAFRHHRETNSYTMWESIAGFTFLS